MIRASLALSLSALLLAGCGEGAGLGMFNANRGAAAPMSDAGGLETAALEAPSDTAAQVAQEFAAGLNARAGQDAGGVSILSARAEGAAVIADMAVPTAAGDLTEAERAEVGPVFSDALRGGLCGDETARAFFNLGNSLTIRFQGSDAVPLTTVTLTSCAA